MDFVGPFVRQAMADGKNVIYMRFSSHAPLVERGANVKICELNAGEGFESFSTQVNSIISREGKGAYYVFDCLSDLLPAWATDIMIGNFFMVTCPYLYELDTIAYFSILRNNHSFKTIARIRETTQLLLDVYRCEGNYYVHPLKVWDRYFPTMFLPHLKEGETFEPITDSAHAAAVLSYIKLKGTESAKRYLDHWDRLFLRAEELAATDPHGEEAEKMVRKLCRIMIGRDDKIFSLSVRKFSLRELIEIKSRLIGTGYIGGKTTGMLLARKMLEGNRSLGWDDFAEPHDSFYIGSDVFYSYIVQNGWWKLRMEQKTGEGYFSAAQVLREKMLHGKFYEEVNEQFQQIIEYFGTSPIIVRSSSLLEDGFGNAFAGKYESVFCPNQGSPEERYARFVEAIRTVYASTMSEDALAYRRQRGLAGMDEQMALLVQRVSGSHHGGYFFPDIGGVGISYNAYVWNEKMRPEAGMLRLVLGLGTRAVNRVEGDYPRIVALDEPLLKPHADMSDVRRFSQHNVDVINIRNNICETVPFRSLPTEELGPALDHIAINDEEAVYPADENGGNPKSMQVITFDRLLSRGKFLRLIKGVMKTLRQNYDYPIEIEFTVNFMGKNDLKINLLQCRPLQARGVGEKVKMPVRIMKKNMLFRSERCFLGGNVSRDISRVIYVDPHRYIGLNLADKYNIARALGELNHGIEDRDKMPTLLLGPGRWGTSTPSLGVPVKFAEINNIAVIGEIAFSEGNLMPELSFGTHFFQDLVETDIFYVALFPEKKNTVFNTAWFARRKNLFKKLMTDPEFNRYGDVIKVYDVRSSGLRIMSDIVAQQVVCFSGV
ncbi:MAG: PEP/pyruvate-binding domain-containing protein [Candidatus Omnitrophica bacterium]|nr:PEP/pyruvate-binding domain-containing protein [Candidatus Omnitrophota bacterium]MDD5487909.1 PEP/pyruvate-binding domain-containing protein [Candidatus Omnitrophota bacterium]